MSTNTMSGPVTVISADSHAGAPKMDYKQYLAKEWHEEFDEWAGKYENPFVDLNSEIKTRSWDTTRRNAEQYGDGIVAEVIFPNTIPPFFPAGQLIARPPSARSYEKRMAGLRAHNRWMVDFEAEQPNQRRGLAQVFLNNVDDAIAEAKWAAEAGLKSIMVPAIPPDVDIPGFFTKEYDELWAVCQDLDLVVTQHGGGGLPSYGRTAAVPFLMLMEVPFFSNRSLWHLILTGVFERFPNLKYVMTEQGVAWLPSALNRLDSFWEQVNRTGRVGELAFTVDELMPHKPSDYFNRNCWVGASFPAPSDAAAILELGVDRVMWGSDYPHEEASFPHSQESLRHTFAGWSDEDRTKVLTTNIAGVYGFDIAPHEALAAEHGPTYEELNTPIDSIPENDSPAFTRDLAPGE